MALLMAMTASTALVACGDDDDDDINNGIDSRIVGTWNSTVSGKLIVKFGTDESTVDYEFKNNQLVLTSDVKGNDWREVEVSYLDKGAYTSRK